MPEELEDDSRPPPRADDDLDPSVEARPAIRAVQPDDIVVWFTGVPATGGPEEGQVEVRVVEVAAPGVIAVQRLEELEPPEGWEPTDEQPEWVAPDRPVIGGVVLDGGVSNGTGFWRTIDG